MSDAPQTVWVTKYALTDGVREVQGELANSSPSMFVVRSKEHGRVDGYYHGEGKEWHRTREAALARAEEMRIAKIASHEKSIAKLRKLSFA